MIWLESIIDEVTGAILMVKKNKKQKKQKALPFHALFIQFSRTFVYKLSFFYFARLEIAIQHSAP